MTTDFAIAMRRPVHEIVGNDGCLVLSPADVQDALAREAFAPKKPTPSVL